MAAERFYNTFSFLYPVVDLFLKPQKRKLLREINTCPPGCLLEIGVGNGSHLHLYSSHDIIAIDTSRTMLETARKRNVAGIQLMQMDGERLTFHNQSFDYVVLSHVLAVVDNPENMLEEVHRVLKPNGQLFILNHVTPTNWLKLVDHALHRPSRLIQFRSVFYVDRLHAIKKFTLLREIDVSPLSYFKLLIYARS